MFKVLFFCLIVKIENEERWQSLKSTYSENNKKKKHKTQNKVKHLANPNKAPKNPTIMSN